MNPKHKRFSRERRTRCDAGVAWRKAHAGSLGHRPTRKAQTNTQRTLCGWRCLVEVRIG